MKVKEKNKVRGKSNAAGATTTGAATEIVNNVSEIDQATARHQAAERETAAVLAQNDKATGRRTETESEGGNSNGQAVAEPVKKPAMLTDEAEQVRRSILGAAFDKFNEAKKDSNSDDFKAARKELRRVKLVVVYQAVEAALAGRPENSVTADELRTHIESSLAALPAEAGDDQFDLAAVRFVKTRRDDVQRTLWDLFKGRYNVSLDEVLVKEAEISIGRDTRRPFGLKADGGPTDCAINGCKIRFVPLAWRDRQGWTGHYLIRIFPVEDGKKEKVAYCERHRKIADQDGQRMLSGMDADRALGVFKRDEEERKSVRADLGSIANVQVVGGRIVTKGQQNSGGNDRKDTRKQPGTFNPELAEKCRNPFSALVNNREKDYPKGRYYSPEFAWDDKRSGKTVQTFLDLEVSKWSVVVSDAGPGLENLIGTQHNTGYFENKGLFVAINKAADAQQQ